MWLRPATGRVGEMVASGDPHIYAMDALSQGSRAIDHVEFLLLRAAQNYSSVSVTLCFLIYHLQSQLTCLG